MTLRTDLGSRLHQRHPDLVLGRSPDLTSSAEIAGFETPAWLAYVTFVAIAFAFGLLVLGPQPWWATRWAWFWLFLTPVGIPAFVLLSGPLPLLPRPRPGRRRLTGGWAFLLLLVWNAVS